MLCGCATGVAPTLAWAVGQMAICRCFAGHEPSRNQASASAKKSIHTLRPKKNRLMSEISAPVCPSQLLGKSRLPVVLQAGSAGWWLSRVMSHTASAIRLNSSTSSWLNRLSTRTSNERSAGLGSGVLPVRNR